jgi:hypothetical protein
MKKLIFFLLLSGAGLALASQIGYKNIRYMDMDGDLADEIIIEGRHSAGTGHYIEDLRIFRDEYPNLKLVFSVRTLDSYFAGKDYNYDIVSEVKFGEQTPANKGARDIIVRSKKVFYKDNEHKVIEREEKLADKAYKWNGTVFEEMPGE